MTDPSAKSGARGRGKAKAAKAPHARDTIAKAAEALGGFERLVEWSKEDAKNEAVFWRTLYPKLITVRVTGSEGGPIAHAITIRFV